MGNLNNFLSGQKIVREINSFFNGKIVVVRSLGLGTYIKIGGLTQSGGIVKHVWASTLKKIGRNCQPGRVLILGFGGGSAAKLVRKYWPKTIIEGIEIDPVMIKLAREYLDADKIGAKIILGDAVGEVDRLLKSGKRFDLVLVDVYLGDKIPKKMETNRFLKKVFGLLSKGGIAIFNRLYYGEKRAMAMRFAGQLEKVFLNVDYFYPEANLMLIARKV